jgi:hypothetical protein
MKLARNLNTALYLLALVEKVLTEVAASRGDEKLKTGLFVISQLQLHIEEMLANESNR